MGAARAAGAEGPCGWRLAAISVGQIINKVEKRPLEEDAADCLANRRRTSVKWAELELELARR